VIQPTIPCELYRNAGFDLHGQARLALVGRFKAAPVRLQFSQQHTTVRTDSAASRGSAMEEVSDVRVLVKPGVGVCVDDMVLMLGKKLRVVQVHPRYTVTGVHDHDQVQFTAWA
jgi:hypothetical protein